MYRSYKIRIRPTSKQREALTTILDASCDLYNAALQERRDAWSLCRKSIGLYEQQKQLTEIRAMDEPIRNIAADIAREPLRRVDHAFKAFFRRCKSGQKPGYPRFKAKSHYDSFAFNAPFVRVKHDRLMIPNIGGIKMRLTRELCGVPKSVIVTRKRYRWEARIICDLGPAPEKVAVSTAVGIDVGIRSLATLSDGIVIDNPRWTKQFENKIARAHQTLARKRKGSRNRLRAIHALNRTYERSVNARRNFLHHVSKWLINNYDLIAYEKLNINGMARNIDFAKSILDAAWGELIWQISYKAESAGRWAVSINPMNTTQKCSGCEALVKKTLSERVHSCPYCGLTLCRDENAARNILRLGKSLAGFCPSECIQEVCI